MLMYLVVGDWSDDGHGKTEKFLIESNKPIQEVRAAYNKGCKIAGFDLTESACINYLDNTIPPDILKKLYGVLPDFVKTWLFCADTFNADLHLSVPYDIECAEFFADIWIQIAQLGDGDLHLEYHHEVESINIGGYGVFCE